MSVLNRKLFAPVRMHSGGVPPHDPNPDHRHDLGNSEYSDEQVRKMVIQQRKELEEEEVTEQFKTLHLPKTQESDAD